MRLNGVGFFTVVVENQEKDKWNPFVSRVCVVRLVQPQLPLLAGNYISEGFLFSCFVFSQPKMH